MGSKIRDTKTRASKIGAAKINAVKVSTAKTTRESAFVDSSAFISALDKSDSFHPLFRSLFSDPPKLLTTSLVISEAQAWFLRRFDTYRSLQFLDFTIALPMLTILAVGKDELSEGQAYLQKFSDQSLTMVDAVSLYAIKKHKIKSCWSTDRHLSLRGCYLAID